MKKKCLVCIFVQTEKEAYNCRRYPPSVFPVQRHGQLGKIELGTVAMFPPCPPDMLGCGEYQLDSLKVVSEENKKPSKLIS